MRQNESHNVTLHQLTDEVKKLQNENSMLQSEVSESMAKLTEADNKLMDARSENNTFMTKLKQEMSLLQVENITVK